MMTFLLWFIYFQIFMTVVYAVSSVIVATRGPTAEFSTLSPLASRITSLTSFISYYLIYHGLIATGMVSWLAYFITLAGVTLTLIDLGWPEEGQYVVTRMQMFTRLIGMMISIWIGYLGYLSLLN